ncbi:MAG: hypothetical protein RL199_1333 [Pseudomonadota bacterium]|jgi:threonine dehydratase
MSAPSPVPPPATLPVDLAAVAAARARIKDRIRLTPCPVSEAFSKVVGGELHLKLDNLQVTGSFKERGALHKLLLLTPEERRRGVICASAGNHAQGVSHHAGRLGIPATIVMPEASPLIKVTGVKAHGATVVLHGANFDEALAEAKRRCEAEGLVFIHPFDDAAVIAGQGTLGLEILEQVPAVDTLLVPVGGGGLIGGIAAAVKALKPEVRVVGVEASVLPKMRAALDAGGPVTLEPARTIADGIAVRRAGDLTYALVSRLVDEMVVCDDEETSHAILQLLEREKLVAEGAGAIALAAALHAKVDLRGRCAVALVCGGNIDVTLVSRIIERGLVKDGRLVRLAVTVPDRPGELARLTGVVARAKANVVEIHHNRAFSQGSLGETLIELVLETRGHAHIDELVGALEAEGSFVRRG